MPLYRAVLSPPLLSTQGFLSAPEVHLAICMHLGISHRLSALRKEHLHLRLVPTQSWEVYGADYREEVFTGSAVVHAHESHHPTNPLAHHISASRG